MEAIKQRWNYLFQSTKGLALVNIALISMVTAFLGMLSGPMQEFGISAWIIKTFNMVMVEAEREGRIIMLYHTIAVAVVALEVYFITDIVSMKPHERSQINATVTFGYILTMIFGLGFAYWGHNFVFHGLYLFGLSLSFFGGILLAAALWPWKKEYLIQQDAYAQTKGGVDLERTAFFTMTIATLGSAMFGAITGSYWGNGHETFLAEDLIREPHKTFLQNAIIGHLHIMLTLIAIALTLIIGKWYDFKGILHKIAMPLMIFGTIVISLGAWSVTVVEWAHSTIYVGSVFVLLAALFLIATMVLGLIVDLWSPPALSPPPLPGPESGGDPVAWASLGLLSLLFLLALLRRGPRALFGQLVAMPGEGRHRHGGAEENGGRGEV